MIIDRKRLPNEYFIRTGRHLHFVQKKPQICVINALYMLCQVIIRFQLRDVTPVGNVLILYP